MVRTVSPFLVCSYLKSSRKGPAKNRETRDDAPNLERRTRGSDRRTPEDSECSCLPDGHIQRISRHYLEHAANWNYILLKADALWEWLADEVHLELVEADAEYARKIEEVQCQL
jgi:hypothetical protein